VWLATTLLGGLSGTVVAHPGWGGLGWHGYPKSRLTRCLVLIRVPTASGDQSKTVSTKGLFGGETELRLAEHRNTRRPFAVRYRLLLRADSAAARWLAVQARQADFRQVSLGYPRLGLRHQHMIASAAAVFIQETQPAMLAVWHSVPALAQYCARPAEGTGVMSLGFHNGCSKIASGSRGALLSTHLHGLGLKSSSPEVDVGFDGKFVNPFELVAGEVRT
jgi:hypothetical protein